MYLGLAAAGGLGYYMYRAGGSPQIAKKEMEIDAHKARAKMPRGSEAARVGEEFGKEVNATGDEAVSLLPAYFYWGTGEDADMLWVDQQRPH